MEAVAKSHRLDEAADHGFRRILETYISKGKDLDQTNQHCFLRRES
jgi:hypothetical protein